VIRKRFQRPIGDRNTRWNSAEAIDIQAIAPMSRISGKETNVGGTEEQLQRESIAAEQLQRKRERDLKELLVWFQQNDKLPKEIGKLKAPKDRLGISHPFHGSTPPTAHPKPSPTTHLPIMRSLVGRSTRRLTSLHCSVYKQAISNSQAS